MKRDGTRGGQGTMKTDTDTQRGRMYWGPGPLPHGATLAGAVTRGNGDAGALLRMPTGRNVQGNAGAIRSLPTVEKTVDNGNA